MTDEIEDDKVPAVVPDVTPETPADEAPVVPDAPKPDTKVPDASSKVEEKLDSLIEAVAGLTAAVTASVPVAGLPDDDSPKPRPWTHRGLSRSD